MSRFGTGWWLGGGPGFGNAITDGGAVLSAFSAAKAAIIADAGDVNILVMGDSTGDYTDEWVYLFAQWLGTQYPAHSVSYRLFNNGTNVYGAATTISTGSGSNTIRIWNACVGGTAPVSLMLAPKYAAAVEAISPNLIIWNYGHNLNSGYGPNILSLDSAYSPWMERVQATHPSAQIAVFSQNPDRDDNLYAPRYAMLQSMAADKPGLTLLDSYAKFIAAGKSPALYSDNIHPSASGTQLYLAALTEVWDRSSAQATTTEAWLASTGTNLLLNGDFASFTPPTLTSWYVTPNATVTKELAIVDGSDAYSLKVEQTGASQGYVRQALSAGNLATAKAAGSVSFAVRRYMPASADSLTGQLFVDIAGPTASTRIAYALNTRLEDEWHWMFIRDITIPSDATAVTFYLYSSSTNRANAIAYFSRAVVVAGDIPRDMA